MKSLFFFTLFGIVTYTGFSQNDIKFSIKKSQDTILSGNILQVVFQLDNGKGSGFEPPLFEKFQIVQGPSTQSYFSMVNGAITQSLSFTYWIKPKEEGILFIEPASITVDGKVLETEIKSVVVLPNPDGLVEEPTPLIDNEFFKERIPPQPRKNRKTTKL